MSVASTFRTRENPGKFAACAVYCCMLSSCVQAVMVGDVQCSVPVLFDFTMLYHICIWVHIDCLRG